MPTALPGVAKTARTIVRRRAGLPRSIARRRFHGVAAGDQAIRHDLAARATYPRRRRHFQRASVLAPRSGRQTCCQGLRSRRTGCCNRQNWAKLPERPSSNGLHLRQGDSPIVVGRKLGQSPAPASGVAAALAAGSVRISAADATGKPIAGAMVKVERRDLTLLAESIALKDQKAAPERSAKPAAPQLPTDASGSGQSVSGTFRVPPLPPEKNGTRSVPDQSTMPNFRRLGAP